MIEVKGGHGALHIAWDRQLPPALARFRIQAHQDAAPSTLDHRMLEPAVVHSNEQLPAVDPWHGVLVLAEFEVPDKLVGSKHFGQRG